MSLSGSVVALKGGGTIGNLLSLGACCMLCCMSATRTQVYLTEDQRRRIDEVTRTEGVTLAEVVRRAVDAYLDRELVDSAAALASTFGANPDAVYPDRDEWDRG